MAHTGAARAGVENLTKTTAVEWAENGVRINSVAPGIIYSDTAEQNYGIEGFFDSLVRQIPAWRLGDTSEVSSVVCFLLSPGASYVTGNTVYIDGASHLYSSNYQVEKHSNFQPPNCPTSKVTTPKSKL